jgi:hypothetical protein
VTNSGARQVTSKSLDHRKVATATKMAREEAAL